MSSQPAVHREPNLKQHQQVPAGLADPMPTTPREASDPPVRDPFSKAELVSPSAKKRVTSQHEIQHEVAGTRDALLTVSEVAKRLGMSEQWVRDHIDKREPKITVVRWGAAVRFRPSDIERFIIENLNAPRRRRRA